MKDLIERLVEDISPTTSIFRIFIYLAFKGATKPIEIVEETDIPAGTVYPALRELLENGFITQLDSGAYQSNIDFTYLLSELFSISSR